MKVLCLGGGPASLYFSILMKKANPNADIRVLERGDRSSTWGFGVVFSDDTLKGFMQADAPTYRRIVEQFAYWGGINTTIHGTTINSRGHGFCGISRLKLLNILHDRCDELGVHLQFGTDVVSVADLHVDAYDLVIAGDGISSLIREAYAEEFGTTTEWRSNKFCWLATTKPLDDFQFIFKKNEHGWWWVHAYRYEEGATTWIVECSEATWRSAGLDSANEEATKAYCESLFREELDGHPLLANRSVWRSFPVVRNERLHYRNMVLLGDAVRSAHFSIGSGTKLAMEDAMALVDCLQRANNQVPQALEIYQETRKIEADKLQRTAVVSLSWFERIDRYAELQQPEQFTFNMLCRSKRMTYENLRLRDPGYIASVDGWFAAHARRTTGIADIDVANPVVPAYQPFRIGEMQVVNRFQLSAMCQYCAEDGNPTDWHLVHYGARAVGGAGLLNTEMICVSPEARITPGCAGLWNDQQTAAWRRIVNFVHAHSKAKFCAQLGHAGRKGATCQPWVGAGMDQPLADGAWETIAASSIPYLESSAMPRMATTADMDQVTRDFETAVRNANRAGFDMIELHLAHGYLLSGFISPCTNHRTDEFGGDIEGRMRFPLRVVKAARAAWPPGKPLSARISATDWVDGGLSEQDMLSAAQMLKDAGADVINVSTGQVTQDEDPVYGRMFQVPYADQIRHAVGIPTIVAGNITTADQANTLIAAGRTDLVALGRPLMNDPHLVLTAAARYGVSDQFWPLQYQSGRTLAETMAEQRNRELLELRREAKPPNPSEALAIAVARGELLGDQGNSRPTQRTGARPMTGPSPQPNELVTDTHIHRRVYTDQNVFNLEMDRIWGKAWLYVGHESQVPSPGSYLTVQLGHAPAVMVRDNDMNVHVLHNRCGHKGAKLVDKPCGRIGGFHCCYHGWTYRLDGKLLGVPNIGGYAGTPFNKDEPQYSMQKFARYDSHRGFVFATLDPNAPDLRAWLGGAGDVIDNLCDRSPEGEVEAAGGVLRYDHPCNWKMFIENLNDTMHPMIVHRSVVDAANDYIGTLPEDSPHREEAEIIPPFGASYKAFEATGITGFRYGHHYDGGKSSIHADYSVDPDYERAMINAYGKERTREILTWNTHNTLFYPSVTIKSAIQNIRVVRPIAVNRCIIETHSFRLKGAPDSLLQRTLLYSRLINSNGSMVGPDDLTVYSRMQEGLASSGSDWVEMCRNHGSDRDQGDRLTNTGTSDLDIRTQYGAWRHYMCGEDAA
ncbi:MAG: Rieske 2Fe-2S domain-containing protein [Gammaproteobacteria bacterium]|nr:Rieske 2Fe-2S domain-containing protein [Gammaproteobacteria bacterium]MYF49110.1 Rieske 2Fe-2S domain-containing protein [Gammaproteobacteria bacterium]